MSGEVNSLKGGGAEAKASLNRAIESDILDPNPGELHMARLNFVEIRGEDRTHRCCKNGG